MTVELPPANASGECDDGRGALALLRGTPGVASAVPLERATRGQAARAVARHGRRAAKS